MSREAGKSNSELLFFILIYLLLFYDGRFLLRHGNYKYAVPTGEDSTPLFFILIFLILFY